MAPVTVVIAEVTPFKDHDTSIPPVTFESAHIPEHTFIKSNAVSAYAKSPVVLLNLMFDVPAGKSTITLRQVFPSLPAGLDQMVCHALL